MLLETSLVFSCEFSAIFQNQGTKFDQFIEREKYFSPKIMLKMRSGYQFQTFFCLLKIFTKGKSKWLKLQVSSPETGLKRDSSTGIFLRISHIFFEQPHLQNTWMTASADSSIPTKVLSHFYDHTFFIFSFMFFFLLLT